MIDVREAWIEVKLVLVLFGGGPCSPKAWGGDGASLAEGKGLEEPPGCCRAGQGMEGSSGNAPLPELNV